MANGHNVIEPKGVTNMARSIANTKDGIRRLNTKVKEIGNCFYVTLYATMVYSEDEFSVTLNNGGWVTPTTASRMNQALIHRGFQSAVGVRKGVMYFGDQPFVNGKYVIVK